MRIKNWRKFQHYKRRNPPWIRAYNDLLHDPEWFELSGDASRMLLNLWLIASEDGINGELPPVKDIAFRLRMKLAEVEALISELDHWLDKDASTMLADCSQDARPESESESESEKKNYRFAGRTIKLTDSLYDSWKTNYPNLDLNAELQALDDWVSSQEGGSKNWVFLVSGALKNKNQKAAAKKVRVASKQFKPEKVVIQPTQAEREAQVQKLWRDRGKNALVCGNDQGQKGTSGQPKPKSPRLRDVFPALQGANYPEEDEAKGGNQALPH